MILTPLFSFRAFVAGALMGSTGVWVLKNTNHLTMRYESELLRAGLREMLDRVQGVINV